MTPRLLLGLALVACSDPRTLGEGPDLVPDLGSDTPGSPADSLTDAADDAPVDIATDVPTDAERPGDAAPDAPDALGPPPVPAERPLALDWAVQSSGGEGAAVLWPHAIGRPDGGLVVVATYGGAITFGPTTILGSNDQYAQALFARVTPEGSVAALTQLCQGCAPGALAALPDGKVAFASAVHGAVVLAPGSAEEVRVTADHHLLVAVVDGGGRLLRSALVARFPGQGTGPRALVARPDGGLVVAGDAFGLEVAGGPSFTPDEGWHYPGRAFVIGLDATLAPRFAEALGGPAGSTIGLVHADGDALVTVGDFGGYPLGVAAIFGQGTDAELALPSVSSDDDPAMDIFVARWRVPSGPDVGRPSLVWARRIAHYSNGPRIPTWIRAGAGPGESELRVDGAAGLEPDGAGHLRALSGDTYPSLVAAFDAAGAGRARFDCDAPIVPSPGGFVSVTTSWGGFEVVLGADPALRFTIPAGTSGPEGVDRAGHVLARWRPDGALVAAGMLVQEVPNSMSPLSLHAAVPVDDGGVLLLLHGAAPTVLVPSDGAPLSLARGPGYERLVVARAHLLP